LFVAAAGDEVRREHGKIKGGRIRRRGEVSSIIELAGGGTNGKNDDVFNDYANARRP
jgi:hypothetical protein